MYTDNTQNTYTESIKRYMERHALQQWQPKAVLFDMDGVIYDSMPAHAHAWNKAMMEFGMKLSHEEVYANEGMRGEEVIACCVREQLGREASDEEIRTIYARKAEIIVQEFGELPMMPGTLEVMHQIKRAGLQIVVVTGSGQPSTLRRLSTDHPGLILPDKIISSKDCTQGKPHPQPYLKGAEKAGVKPWEAIAVENAPLGVRSAVSAGLFTIAVNTGPLPHSLFWEEKTDILMKKMSELRDSIKDIILT